MLERMGFSVLTAKDGRDAVEVYREHHADIRMVLLDLTMPYMNGEEAFRELKQVRQDVVVVLCSGYNEQEAVQHFSGEGLAGFIQKPFTLMELRSVLQQALERV
jgi:CheY-like chemotaxis protein